MYCDPLAAEGLFPLDPTKDDGRTERDLQFEYTPGVDYFAKFDAILPAWRRPRYLDARESLAALSTEHGDSLVDVRVGRRQTRTLSHRRYVRAIAPDGSLRQLVISSVRASPAYPDGLDACATHTRMINKKNQCGWIIVENDPAVWSPYVQLRDQQYAAWAWAVMQRRKELHAADMKQQSEAFMSKAERATRQQTEVIADALAQAVNGERKGKKARPAAAE